MSSAGPKEKVHKVFKENEREKSCTASLGTPLGITVFWFLQVLFLGIAYEQACFILLSADSFPLHVKHSMNK